MSDLETFLRRVEADWPQIAAATVTNRLTLLYGCLVNMKVAGGESFAVTFLQDRLIVTPGADLRPNAVVEMSQADWQDVLSGRAGIMSVIVAGRCPYPKHHRMPIAKLSLVLQTLATMELSS
ncbi:hypothetical protein [Falsigemmobacter faecalis]|uniref:hypothetical protein n=1 Tax=Falsigemmobacter faecalis TaxID=2488730 RepID=UPI00131538CB|nr:hypothetical protein [Falsigemmobacter faecalis]